MEERADDLNEKIEELNRQIVTSLTDYDVTKVIVSKRMELDDQQIRNEIEKDYLAKLKSADEACRKMTSEHILIYLDANKDGQNENELTDSQMDRNKDC